MSQASWLSPFVVLRVELGFRRACVEGDLWLRCLENRDESLTLRVARNDQAA